MCERTPYAMWFLQACLFLGCELEGGSPQPQNYQSVRATNSSSSLRLDVQDALLPRFDRLPTEQNPATLNSIHLYPLTFIWLPQ